MTTLQTGQMDTVEQALNYLTDKLSQADLYYGHGTDNAADDALQLVFQLLDISFDSDESVLTEPIGEQGKSRLLHAIDQRITQRIPVPYITGQAWFAGLPFTVNDQVLIPRSPIAELIERGFQPWLGSRSVNRLLDLCTGSGCIGIACGYYFTEAKIDLADISAEALDIARVNIGRHQMSSRTKVIYSDVFDGLIGQRYDLIVSNPPYVDQADFTSMPEEYQHEPALALTSGNDGLDICRQILKQAADYLNEKGLLVVEVGNSWENLEAAFPQVAFTWLEFERGGHGIFVFTREELEQYSAAFL
jgi:ribosomal protein L3 glutamine methyltransferase